MYRIGLNRIFYRPSRFTEKEVTVYFYNTNLEQSEEFTMQELEPGIYYLDYHFPMIGDYLGVFSEDGERRATHVFKVDRRAALYYNGIPIM